MNVLAEILEWSQNCPMWQRDALRRLLQNESGLSGTDYSELYALLKKENGIEADNDLTATPLAGEHIPADPAPEETITLVALRELGNVNQIPSDQILPFSKTGMTVIYGGNGSGKSGYARVMKRACRTRGQLEPIHPNANDPAAVKNIPTAKFDVIVSGTLGEIAWSHDEASPDTLSTISVFDSQCARSYLTESEEVAYLPYGLDIIENLANQVIPDLLKKITAELDGINIEKLPFEHLQGETSVGKMIADLSAESNKDAIKILGTLTEEEINHATKLGEVLNEADPLSKARELRLSAARLKEYADKLAESLTWVSSETVEKIKGIVEEREAAETAETKAADALRAGETLLPGTGEQTWKLLFDAAKRYSTEIAYPGDEFPPATEDKVCPLCQKELGEVGTQRLNRFNEYIKNDVAKTADTSRKKVDSAKGKIESADLKISAEKALRGELNEMDSSLIESIDAFHERINLRRDSMLQCLKTKKWGEIPALIESPRNRVRQLAANQFMGFRVLTRVANEDKKKKITEEFNELSARQSFAKSLQPVLDLLQRMKSKAALEKCRQRLNTRPISTKSKELVTAAVTEDLQNALNQEFNTLGIGHIQTKLKEKGGRGKTFHQLELDLPTVNKIHEILSEGEQRAIALGSFLAELSLANHSCGIVFDDPVSSLDHKRRGKVAKRLVEESENRQVVVFTHDVVFLQDLRDECVEGEIELSITSLDRNSHHAGIVTDEVPWAHMSIAERIDSLEKTLKRFEKLPWPADPSDELAREMIRQYNYIRATIERITQDLVLNGVVQRFQLYIKVPKLREVVGLREEEVTEIIRLNQRCNNLVEAHDPASAKENPPPTLDEFRKDIDDIKSLIDQINNRRSQ